MVADALKVFCNHQQIKGVLGVKALGADHFDQRAAAAYKAVVNDIIMPDYAFRKLQVTLYICVDAVRHKSEEVPFVLLFYFATGTAPAADITFAASALVA